MDIKDIILPVGVIGLAAFFGNKLVNDKTDTTDETVTDAEKDVEKDKLSYKVSWYSQASDTIQQNLLNTWKFGDTGNKAIATVLLKLTSLKNIDDWNMLVAKFGKRSGSGVSVIYKEAILRWLIYFLEGKTYYYTIKGVKKKGDALHTAKYILKGRGIIL